ncbi:PEP-CTERM sorting domain-containing protein [Blastopirellula marina]|uniref:Ice-binding protein C-terminal domain-containing protein n=1 Tax=Blastopirellula marina TaxID=124 RepID=A0A2S8FWR9_9BACT|nr:PEP-CTERM sorting domain-containing protein [Blastopirellula marina]PQO36603.1 hypothetical protein C5Y98_11445 [Blastopirellula marina]PTL44433.1 PEP-CTERM sorting domain-containing protein [Blastopirellula marina]
MKLLLKTVLGLFLVGCTWNVSQAETLTSQAIFGSGNSNTLFNVVRTDGVEIGLRAKVRYENDDSIVGENSPQDVYYIDHVVDPSDSNLASWNFDWSVNTNFDGSGANLANYTFLLSIEYDPLSSGGSADSTSINPAPTSGFASFFNDNAYGNNSTVNGGGVEPWSSGFSPSPSTLHNNNNVMQNSLNVGFAGIGFDPSYSGLYTIILSVFDGGSSPLATNQIQVYAGVEPPSAVPEPTSMAILGMGVLGFVGGGVARRRLKQKKEASNS